MDIYRLKEKIGTGIKEARNHAEMTRNDLSEAIIQESDTIKKWETGKNLPSIDKLHDISSATKEPLFQMMGFDNKDIHLTKYPFFFTQEEEQLFWATQKANPKYSIEAFWTDIVIPGREKNIIKDHRLVSITDLIYEKNELARMLKISPVEFQARSKGKLRPMRNLDYIEDGEVFKIKHNDKIIYSTKAKETEKTLSEFIIRVLDELAIETKTPYTYNECFSLMNHINDATKHVIFSPSLIVDPNIKENSILIDIPKMFFQNSLRKIIHPSFEHLRFELPLDIDKNDPINSIIRNFHKVQDDLLDLGNEYFEFYDPSLNIYQDAIIGGLFYFFFMLKEQIIELPLE